MEISIPVSVDLIDSNVVDHTEHYDQKRHVDYKKGLRLQDRSEVWERTGDDLLPPDYEPAKDSTYKTGDVLWAQNPVSDGYGQGGLVDGVLHVAGRSTAPVPLQPDLYPNAEHSFDKYSQWKERYVLVKTGITGDFTGFNQDSGTGDTRYLHRLFKNSKSPTGWTYEIVKQVHNVPYWNDSEFTIPDKIHPTVPKTYIRINTVTNAAERHVKVFYDNDEVADLPNDQFPTGGYTPYGSVFRATYQGTYAGRNFLLGDLERTQYDKATGITYKFYRLCIEGHKDDSVTADSPAYVLDYIDSNTVETRSYATDSTAPDTAFILRTFIVRGDKLYARTEADAVQLSSTTTKPKLERLASIRDFKGGWTYVSPIEKLKPFDGKTYTQIEANNEITFSISVPDAAFNTVAFTGLIAKEISVETRAGHVGGGGHQNLGLHGYIPDGSRDVHKRLPPVPTTAIVYNDIPNGGTTDTPAGGHIIVTIKGKNIRLGGIWVGLSVNAGFTNLVFQNRYKDWSPYEKDQWGNVTYIEGVKTNIHSGTVDVPIRHYDMMNRLMTSLGQGLVILNGSDNLSNRPPDNNRNIFASTMVVGRIRNFALKTNLDNKHMGEMATYSFEIEESV
jgi:hypothetical protein